VSSLVEDEENGADITRLALVDGTVYRQQTRISGLITILILIGIPLAVVLGLLAAILLVAFLHWKRARKIPRL